jgi:hypothetical protein
MDGLDGPEYDDQYNTLLESIQDQLRENAEYVRATKYQLGLLKEYNKTTLEGLENQLEIILSEFKKELNTGIENLQKQLGQKLGWMECYVAHSVLETKVSQHVINQLEDAQDYILQSQTNLEERIDYFYDNEDEYVPKDPLPPPPPINAPLDFQRFLESHSDGLSQPPSQYGQAAQSYPQVVQPHTVPQNPSQYGAAAQLQSHMMWEHAVPPTVPPPLSQQQTALQPLSQQQTALQPLSQYEPAVPQPSMQYELAAPHRSLPQAPGQPIKRKRDRQI